jgi:hypothetical protein
LITSCKKNQDKTIPTIELYTPKENDTLSSTNLEYEIKFNAHDETMLSKEFISIIDADGTVLTSEERDIFGTDYYYSNTFIFNGTKGQLKKLTLHIRVIDKSGNTCEKMVVFNVKI